MYKIIRDPIYSEIKLNPLEILIIDNPLFQRLRNISQLVGTSWVFPSSTHNRFSHSLGVLHISSLYSSHLFKNDLFKQVVIRLSALLHDIAHGPFSHQFDDTIYKSLNIINGHDSFRKKVITKFLPVFIIQKLSYDFELFIKLKEFIFSLNFPDKFNSFDIKNFNSEIIFDNGFDKDFKYVINCIFFILNEVLEVYDLKGSIEHNIIQGPFGADRLDFIRRDSYFSGATGFSTGSIDRIIFNTKIIDNKLAYHIKTFDEIFSVLFGRFMMYKNVYFHKTSRSIDLLIQEILENSVYIFKEINLDYKNILNNAYLFLNLTDDFILNTVYNLFLFQKQKIKFSKTLRNKKIKKLLDYSVYLINNLKFRKIFKLILEKYIYKKISLDSLKNSFRKLLIKNKNENFIFKEILKNFEDMFLFDISEEVKLFDPVDIENHNIFLYNEFNDLFSFREFVKHNPIYDIKSKKIRIFRIYLKDYLFSVDNEMTKKIGNYFEVVKFLRSFIWKNRKELDELIH